MRVVPLKARAACVVPILTLLSLIALVVAAPQADAGTLICKSSYTDSKDREHLSAAMQRVFPFGVRAVGIPDICRNPGTARAWLSTWAHLRSDGITEWWMVVCARESRDWTCEPPVHRRLIWVYAEVGGTLRRLEVSFDDATELAQAQRSAVHAVRIIQDPSSAPLPACGFPSTDERQREWKNKQDAHALTPADTVVELAVESEETGVVHVITNGGDKGSGLGLAFTDGSSGLPAEGRACWEEWVVVG